MAENKGIVSEDGKIVSVVTDGSVERLAVDANVTGGIFIQKFTPIVNTDITGIATNESTDITLESESGHAGKVDFIGIAGSTSNYEAVLKIDGTEVFRVTMSELSSTNLALTGTTGLQLPMWGETANKNFRYYPYQGVDFVSSWEVLVKATGAPNPTVKWMIHHREEA